MMNADQKLLFKRCEAESFTRFMVKLLDWSYNHNCEISINTFGDNPGDMITVRFYKNGHIIRHAFSRPELAQCDEMFVYTALENAYKKLEEKVVKI